MKNEPPKPPTIWTHEIAAQVAAHYGKRTELQSDFPGLYRIILLRSWPDVLVHMPSRASVSTERQREILSRLGIAVPGLGTTSQKCPAICGGGQ